MAADAVAGYTTSIAGACTANASVSLQPGDAKTCTVAANDSQLSQAQQLPPPQPGKNVNAIP